MTSGFITRFVLAVGIALPHFLRAQDAPAKKPIELGFDAALTYQTSDQVKQTAITVPVPRLRIGFFLSDAVSLEPSFLLQYARTKIESSVTGTDRTTSGTSYDLDIGLLYHFTPDRSRTQAFLRPFVGIRGFRAEGESNSQASYGAGIGLKMPAANRLGTRIEVGFAHSGENEPQFESSNKLYASFGLSFFTH